MLSRMYEATRPLSVKRSQMKPHVDRLESRDIFSGKVFSVRTDLISVDGRERRLDIVEHGGSYAVIATPEPHALLLVRQYRHAAGRVLYEIPAGLAERGETLEAGARRELREETGFTAGSMSLVLSAYPSPGFCTEQMHFFHAVDLQAGASQPDEDEDIEVVSMTLERARSMQANGDIADMKTILAILWLSERVGRPNK